MKDEGLVFVVPSDLQRNECICERHVTQIARLIELAWMQLASALAQPLVQAVPIAQSGAAAAVNVSSILQSDMDRSGISHWGEHQECSDCIFT